jgi:hypothetical protein
MLPVTWSSVSWGRVSPAVPAVVALAGIGLFLSGYHDIGIGVVVGAALALLNGVFLSRRVDFAAETGDIGRALMVMQLGLLVTCTLVGVATIILVHFSIALAVADAAGFAVTQILMLVVFYFARARSVGSMERNPS